MSMRLSKYIAACGAASRREADRLIEAGRVTVDGAIAQLGCVVEGKEEIAVDGRILREMDKKVVAAYYKPVGVTCTEKDPHAERTLKDAFSFPVRLTYAGRLDRDSEGLLLMTNDGDLIEAMMRGSRGHEKEYIVRVRQRMSDVGLARMRAGIYLRDLGVRTRPCRVERLGDRTFRIVLTQGLNRQIRRMCRAVGTDVVRLKRVRVLNIELGAMKPGEIRVVTGKEREQLYEAAGIVRR
ncbi:MAG: pseudouridine synthase [Eubacteriales bacterium]|nr:pseudouridine synthase [Eubacteriales bacterium]